MGCTRQQRTSDREAALKKSFRMGVRERSAGEGVGLVGRAKKGRQHVVEEGGG